MLGLFFEGDYNLLYGGTPNFWQIGLWDPRSPVSKGTVSKSGTGHLDCGARGPVPDPSPMRNVSGSGSL